MNKRIQNKKRKRSQFTKKQFLKLRAYLENVVFSRSLKDGKPYGFCNGTLSKKIKKPLASTMG